MEDRPMRRALLLTMIFATAAAYAGDAPGPGKPARPNPDSNGDGVVTREEASAYPRLTADFDSADANKDGQLDATEMNAHRERMRSEMRARADERWKTADTDGDGKLSLAEAQASMPRMAEGFNTFDADRDGFVSRDEMHNFRMKKKKRPD
jgi:hypothetical protein